MTPSASPARIIVLDDNPGFAGAARRFIERLPGDAHAAGDVVLVDLGIAGLDLARRIKRSNPTLGVIALALFPTPELLAEAERAGIDAVVSKEAFAEELPAALARAGVSVAAALANGPAQESLRESEERFRRLTQLSSDWRCEQDPKGEVVAREGFVSETTERKLSDQRLARLAQFDTLTVLPNRLLLHDRLAQSLTQARRHDRKVAVLFVDLDRFKLVNDTLGHYAGDLLIAEVARRLMRCVRPGDTVGRISGNEFAVVLADLAHADDAALVAQKVLQTLAEPYHLAGSEAFATASIGIAVYPGDGDDAEGLLRNADMAMYRAEDSTRNSRCFIAAETNQRSAQKMQLNNELRHAIERGEFVLHYQPKVALGDGALAGFEALLRWDHPARGLVPPAQFVPALEESGLIVPVGEWVLREACVQIARWQRAGFAPVPVAVNLSATQLRRRDLDAVVSGVLAASGVTPALLELEITESCLMEQPDQAVRLLYRLRDAGVCIAVDDFGAGYSSLSYLTRLPIAALKIDRSFVRDAVTNAQAASIVRAVIDMAHNLRFTVVAEGVEMPQQVAFLRKHECDQAQGYHFAHPAGAEQNSRWLEPASLAA